MFSDPRLGEWPTAFGRQEKRRTETKHKRGHDSTQLASDPAQNPL